jgi:2-oxoglutarate/2-oxoacid ferredoxin oxidoreductase subunit beta
VVTGKLDEIIPTLTRKDYVSDQQVRWCPGCGDYSILAQMQKMLPRLGIPKEETVFISGIGCSSRFPYYMDTYGFHSIHGRALTLATGLKTARPELTVFVITGDGDGLSIGGNHLLHAMRRNIDLSVILFNNRIYGLTKGQYSPTSEMGKITKSTPMGSLETPLNPTQLAIAAGATFVARSIDRDTTHLEETLYAAATHKGMSFVEVYQNCNIFNDGAFAAFAEKEVRPDRTLRLAHGKPMLFGSDSDRGIRLNGLHPEIVENVPSDASGIIVHDAEADDPALAMMLSTMSYPDHPVPVGILRSVERPTYEVLARAQVEQAKANGRPDLKALISGPETWEVV